MITRRNCLVGISAAFVSTPAIVSVQNLMRVRGIVMPIHQKNYYGFCDRLGIDFRYRHGELRGPTLIRLIDEGLLRHIPPSTLAYDLSRWGTGELSLAARKERNKNSLDHELKSPTLFASCKDSLYNYKPGG